MPDALEMPLTTGTRTLAIDIGGTGLPRSAAEREVGSGNVGRRGTGGELR
jgi:hypothetical protein